MAPLKSADPDSGRSRRRNGVSASRPTSVIPAFRAGPESGHPNQRAEASASRPECVDVRDSVNDDTDGEKGGGDDRDRGL